MLIEKLLIGEQNAHLLGPCIVPMIIEWQAMESITSECLVAGWLVVS